MIKDQIHTILSHAVKIAGYSAHNLTLETPTNPDFGDYTSSIAMQLAKELKKDPFDVAGEIAQIIPITYPLGSVRIVRPGFINISIATETLLSEVEDIIEKKDKFGKSTIHKNKKVIVEYSSPNIAKPFTVGHLRSTIIGDAVANLLEATGHTVFRDNHIGDWGTQFGKQIYAIQKWGDLDTIEKSESPVKELVALYVKFHEEAETNPVIEDEARAIFKKLEDGDQTIRALWQQCIDWSWKEFDRIYTKLGVKFTENNGRGYGESFFEDKMKSIIAELKEKKLLKESKGAQMVFFPEDKLPPFMILKQDGATLYSTRDLATDKFRLTDPQYASERHPELVSGSLNDVTIINEVGAEQSLYFKQLYETEELLGWITEGQRLHIKHGLYRFKDMKMSTRKGNTIWLEDVLNEAFNKAHVFTTITEKQSDEASLQEQDKMEELQKRVDRKITADEVWEIAMGALKWNDLKRSSHLDIVFDWEEILNMHGNSGPYIQYTYVRCQSVLAKDSQINELENMTLEKPELSLLRLLAKYPEVVMSAAVNHAPHYVCTYLFELAQSYNLFYQKYPILKAEEPSKSLRILITQATAQVVKNGLALLGIKVVEKM
jgi:arginyl-tRNA synthetase